MKLKNLLQNHWTNHNKNGTKHPWVKGIQVCSNTGPHPFPRGDNNEIGKIHVQNLKISFSRPIGPILTKLDDVFTNNDYSISINLCLLQMCFLI